MTGAPDNVPRVPGGRVMAGSTRRLSAIMFTDVVGYSAQVQKNEALALELLDIHRRNLRRQLPGFGGREVETAGDGFLIEFSSALEALRCAIAIQKEQAARNAGAVPDYQLRLRIGIHLGDVEHRHKSLFGDGVNLAARLEPLSPPGGIALSAQIHDQVRLVFPVGYRSLGPQNLKNIAAPLEVFVLDAATLDGLAVPEPRRKRSLLAHRSPWMARTGVVAAALVLAAVAFFSRITAPVEASVAVLPFSNLSEDPAASGYLAGGIHESVLTHLAQIRDLKVISRTSVMEYESGRRNLREIGKALGVANILEGSIQRVGNRVRVTAQLIEVATDRHLWAEAYDRDLSDIFAIQSDVAVQVAGAVQARISTDEKARLATKPTSNEKAYDLYLRAMDFWRRNGAARDNLVQMQPLLEQAISLDPQFALAHAQLARVHVRMYWLAYDPDPARLDKARRAAETALQLQPLLPESHLAMGVHHYAGGDFEGALREYKEALSRRPNSAELHSSIANALRQLSRWDEALMSLNKAVELDPRNFGEVSNLAGLYRGLRRYREAEPLYLREVALAPDDVFAKLDHAWLFVDWRGDLEPLKEALAEVPAGIDPNNLVSYSRLLVAMLEERHSDAARLLEAYPGDWLPGAGGTGREPKDLMLGWVYRASGDFKRARGYFQHARELLLEELRRRPDSAGEYAYVAIAHAALGDREAALRAVQEARRLAAGSGTTTAVLGAYFASTYVMLDELDLAIDELEAALKLPYSLSAHFIRLEPAYRPLRGHPRFEKLISDNLPRD